MAVAKMQKVRILFHQSLKEDVLEEIQRTGFFHISHFGESYPQLPEGLVLREEHQLGELEASLSGVEFALDYLKLFEDKKSALERLAPSRVELSQREYRQLVDQFDGQEVVRACRQLERDRAGVNGEIVEKQALKRQMSGWLELDIPLQEVKPTDTCQVVMGSVPASTSRLLAQRLAEELEGYHLEPVGSSGTEENVLLIYHRAEHETASQILEQMAFTEKRYPHLKGTVQEIRQQLETELAEQQRALRDLHEKSKRLVEHRPKLMVLAEHLADRLERVRAESGMANTERVLVSEGWIKKTHFAKLQQRLEEKFGPVFMTAIEPQPGEVPPVELENKPLPASFEMVIDLYGRPKYTEIDPTPFLAPFFAIFFGLCLTDAGYGLTITALSLFLLKKFRLGPGMRKLFRLLLWSGLATIVAGILTGGYFGIDWSQMDPNSPLVRAVQAVKLFDPIADAMTFFQLAIVLGVIHIFVGLALKLSAGIRQGSALRSVLQHGPWLFADVGVGIFMLNFLSPVGTALARVGTYSLIAGLGGIFLFSGIGSKNPISYVGKGFGGLYGVISIFSDILSYSRLVALGLATAVVAGVIDTLGLLLADIPYVGFILAIILLLVAHLAYLAICCLGAFVHTARLNFVEFFSKFYEGGGEPFQPLRKRGHYVRWNEEREGT